MAQLKCLLLCACILITLTTNGVSGQCSTPPVSQVVYEGAENTIMTCGSSSSVQWTVLPHNPEEAGLPLEERESIITASTTRVFPNLSRLYDISETNLIIKKAELSPRSTAGLYVASYRPPKTGKHFYAKLIVVRKGPSCDCKTSNSTSNSLSCSLEYADYSYPSNYAKMTWTVDGSFYRDDIPNQGYLVESVFTSTSTITIGVKDTRTYTCKVTFTEIEPFSYDNTNYARNVLDFTASCTTRCQLRAKRGVYGQCSTPPVNQAVYEGAENTIMTCGSSSSVEWTVLPHNPEERGAIITVSTTRVCPKLARLYDISETNLIIKTAELSPKSTAGFYVASYKPHDSGKLFYAKLIVVRKGPSCDCKTSNPTSNSLSCSLQYADCTFQRNDAKMTWTVDGSFYKDDIPNRGDIVDGVFTSTSTITIDVTDKRTYTCKVSFTELMHPWHDDNTHLANNAPDFTASCTTRCQ